MTHNPHRVPLSTNFLAVAATALSPRNERVRHPTASAAKRVVHTTHIDAEWDLQSDTPSAHQSGDRLQVRAPHTTIIDAAWDLESDALSAHQSGAHRIDAHAPPTSRIESEEDQEDTVVMGNFEPAGVIARRPHTSLIDTEWDSPPDACVEEQAEAHQGVYVLPQQITLLDMDDMDDLEEETNPIITCVELDGPDCLFESDIEPARPPTLLTKILGY